MRNIKRPISDEVLIDAYAKAGVPSDRVATLEKWAEFLACVEKKYAELVQEHSAYVRMRLIQLRKMGLLPRTIKR